MQNIDYTKKEENTNSRGLAGVCIWGTLCLYTTFFRGISS